ncbi:MAG: hypothetical protein ACHWZW_05235 [Spirulina sp.]
MKKTLLLIPIALIILLNTACSLINVGFSQSSPTSGDLLTIDQVAETGEPGRFLLSGKATLPGEADLTVSAVRRLNPADGDAESGAPSLYGILDRKTATLDEGRWQATLMLWEPSAAGYYQEPWQRPETPLVETARPDATVDFLLTVEPEEFERSVRPVIPRRLETAINDLLYFTPDGEPYLRVSAAQPIPVPTNIQAVRLEETPSATSPWEGRAALDNTNTAIETTPDSPFFQEDNLPISQNRLMR